MKKNNLQMILFVFISLQITFLSQSVRSQIPAPAQWNAFVKDASLNTLAMDTFLFQSFEQNNADTWHYTTEGNAKCGDALSLYGLKGQGGSNSMLLPSYSKLIFDSFEPSSLYKQVYINATLAASNLLKGDALFVEAFRDGVNNSWEWSRITVDRKTIRFRELTESSRGKMSNPIQIQGTPSNISLITPQANKGDCYCIDSVYAFGLLPQYSLFTGSGDWLNNALWSHLPALRHRKALVQGDVSVLTDVACAEIALSGGSVNVNSGASLTVGDLSLYYPVRKNGEPGFTSMQSEGDVNIGGRVTIYKEFPEKGKWYFISFPFDVYADGLDPDFECKDDTPNAGGNYFYACTYNGATRAATAGLGNSWDVMKLDASSPAPLFEKNKGYLIALDGKASLQTLRFTSSGNMPSGFGRCESLPVHSPLAGNSDDDNGWCLCGNPLPCNLSLSRMLPNASLDGYVYVFEDGAYKSYAIGSPYSLPPLSAFFVKAKSDTRIEYSTVPDENETVLCNTPLPAFGCEPEVDRNPVPTEVVPPCGEISCRKEGDLLYVENMPDEGAVHILNLSGYVLVRQKIGRGASVVGLPLNPGLYIVQIQTSRSFSCFKIVKDAF